MRMSSATVYRDNSRAVLGRKKWAVLIPARFSPTGKRMRKFFEQRQEAEQYTALYNANAISIGASIATVTQADIESITKVKAILEGKGVSIIGAAPCSSRTSRTVRIAGESAQICRQRRGDGTDSTCDHDMGGPGSDESRKRKPPISSHAGDANAPLFLALYAMPEPARNPF